MKNIIPFKKDVIFKTNLSEITSISLENTLSLENDTLKGEFIISGDYKVSDRSTTVEPFDIRLPFEISIDDKYDTKSATIDIDDFYYEIVNNNVLSVSIDVLIDKLKEKPLMELNDLVEVKQVRGNLEEEEKFMKELDVNNELRESLGVSEKKDENRENKENIENKESENKKVKEIEIKKEEAKEIKEEKMVTKEEIEEKIIEEERGVIVNEEVEEKINSLFNQFSKDSEVYVTYNVFILRDGDTIDSILEKYNISEEELRKYNDLTNLQLGDKLIIPNVYERN